MNTKYIHLEDRSKYYLAEFSVKIIQNINLHIKNQEAWLANSWSQKHDGVPPAHYV